MRCSNLSKVTALPRNEVPRHSIRDRDAACRPGWPSRHGDGGQRFPYVEGTRLPPEWGRHVTHALRRLTIFSWYGPNFDSESADPPTIRNRPDSAEFSRQEFPSWEAGIQPGKRQMELENLGLHTTAVWTPKMTRTWYRCWKRMPGCGRW